MRIVNGAQLRTAVNINLRTAPSTTAPRIVTLQTGVLVQALAPPTANWLRCVVHGWRHDDHPGYVFSEPDTRSSVEARRGVLGWQAVSIEGYLSMANAAWLTVEDGPE
jgi:hypothetical protein